jgi:hypothetical protein
MAEWPERARAPSGSVKSFNPWPSVIQTDYRMTRMAEWPERARAPSGSVKSFNPWPSVIQTVAGDATKTAAERMPSLQQPFPVMPGQTLACIRSQGLPG